MPREVLTPGPDAVGGTGSPADGTGARGQDAERSDTPFAGFFGKLPASGDFLTRGLSAAFRKAWDGWVTRHLAPLRDAAWPPGGLRFRLVSGGRVAAGVVVPSQDAAGRRFPISLILIAPALPPPPALDGWCDAALAAAGPALAGAAGPDDLWAALEDLAVPGGSGGGGGGMILWRSGDAPQPCVPGAEDEALGTIFRA